MNFQITTTSKDGEMSFLTPDLYEGVRAIQALLIVTGHRSHLNALTCQISVHMRQKACTGYSWQNEDKTLKIEIKKVP